MKYRPEIDGLRGVAIIGVVLFHAGLPQLSGGFTGVDVFFVISGFLITRIILPEIESRTFSFAHFYERRVRRIVPALAFVLLSTLVCLPLVALPDQLDQAARSAIASIFSVSNFYFQANSGYFSTGGEFRAFLHTWSLSVEEQFYIILPIALIYIARRRINLTLCIAIPAFASFLLSLWQSTHYPNAAFYLLPARNWELALGALLAVGAIPAPSSVPLRNAASMVGLGLVAAGYVTIDSSAAFPGWAALMPCVGAALIILTSGPDTLVGRVLAAPPLRGVGLISYSLYLWHWPVLVVSRMALAEQHLSPISSAAAVLVSLVLAVATWRWIELPFRDARRVPLWALAWRLGPSVSVAAVLALVLIGTSGLPSRLSPEARTLLQAVKDVDSGRTACRGVPQPGDPGQCAFGRSADLRGGGDGEIDVLLIGDSHASALTPALERWADANGLRGAVIWQSNCPLLLGADRVPTKGLARCAAFKSAVMDRFATYPNARLVFLSGRWEYNWTGMRPERGGSGREYLVDEVTREWSELASKKVFLRALDRTMTAIETDGRRVILLGAAPEVEFDVPHTLALKAYHGAQVEDFTFGHASGLRAELDRTFRDLVSRHSTSSYVNLWPVFCENERCKLAINGRPVYRDGNHIAAYFAREVVGPYLVDAVKYDPEPADRPCPMSGCAGPADCPSPGHDRRGPCADVADAEATHADRR